MSFLAINLTRGDEMDDDVKDGSDDLDGQPTDLDVDLVAGEDVQ